MSKYITRKYLNINNFKEVGVIEADRNKNILFNVSKNYTKTGVYFWLSEISSNKYRVDYIGKAGSGPKIRMQQHEQGLKKNTNKARRQEGKTLLNAFQKAQEVYRSGSENLRWII